MWLLESVCGTAVAPGSITWTSLPFLASDLGVGSFPVCTAWIVAVSLALAGSKETPGLTLHGDGATTPAS